MGIPFMPVLGTISNLASVAWGTYQKAKKVQEELQTGRTQKAAQAAIAQRVEELEAENLEHARLLGELSNHAVHCTTEPFGRNSGFSGT